MATLLDLPVEIVFRILDNFDELEIIFSIHDVCTRLNLTIDSYYRYRTLSELILWNRELSNSKLMRLGRFLQTNTTLIVLNLGWSGVDIKGAQYLSNALQMNTTLTTLDLSCNSIGTEGAQYLANALETNTTLTMLDLSANAIGVKGAQYLANTMQINLTLKMLDLSDNGIDDKEQQRLLKRFLSLGERMKFHNE